MRILFVEDDVVLHQVVRQSLEDAGHCVESARMLRDADHLWSVRNFDAVVLDLNLPDGSGLSALRAARARNDAAAVIVLTARNRIDERIMGLDAGADDYLAKPFELAELAARLRALSRRVLGVESVSEVGGLRLHRDAGRLFVVRNGARHELELPAREYAVLVELMTPPGRVVSKRGLSEKLSSSDELLADNALEAFVSRLRRKLLDSGATIRTLRGLGYLIEASARP